MSFVGKTCSRSPCGPVFLIYHCALAIALAQSTSRNPSRNLLERTRLGLSWGLTEVPHVCATAAGPCRSKFSHLA